MILNHNKIAIVGYAKTGKTRTGALFNDREVYHTDDDIEKSFFDNKNRFVVEGTRGVWLLRDGLKVDLVIRIDAKYEPYAKHVTQRKAIDTVWKQWLAQKPDCRIMILNEDVAEFMIEMEKSIYMRQEYLNYLDSISPFKHNYKSLPEKPKATPVQKAYEGWNYKIKGIV